MALEKLKVGVAGVGSLGQWHARIYSELPNAQLVGVFDTDPARAAEIAARYGTRPYPTLEALAADITAASVVVPTDRHLAVASTLLERNVHLLLEKPIASSTAEAEQLVAMAQARNLILQVGHVERFNPVMRYLEGILKRPRFIEAHRLAPYPPAREGAPPRGTEVSVVLDLMIHDLEVILHLVQSEVNHLHAVGVPVLSRSEDIANVRLGFENGCVANVTASRISPEPLRKIRVFQEDAYISLDYKNQAGEIYRKGLLGIKKEEVPIEKGEPLLNELAAFVDCVRNRAAPRIGGREASRALALAVAIVQRLREGPS
jgi:predicted dehydrogenase